MKKTLIGKVISAFGIKGDVKIISFCKNATDIEKYTLFDKNNSPITLKIINKNKASIGATIDGEILIAKINDIKDRNLAENLKGLEIFADRKDFAKLKKDEFYQIDLIDLDVVDSDNKKIGKVLEVFDFGGGISLEIKFNETNQKFNIGEIENFPFKNDFFPEVNIEEGFIKINLPNIVISK